MLYTEEDSRPTLRSKLSIIYEKLFQVINNGTMLTKITAAP